MSIALELFCFTVSFAKPTAHALSYDAGGLRVAQVVQDVAGICCFSPYQKERSVFCLSHGGADGRDDATYMIYSAIDAAISLFMPKYKIPQARERALVSL